MRSVGMNASVGGGGRDGIVVVRVNRRHSFIFYLFFFIYFLLFIDFFFNFLLSINLSIYQGKFYKSGPKVKKIFHAQLK